MQTFILTDLRTEVGNDTEGTHLQTKEMDMSSQMKYMHKKYREKIALKRLSDTLWYLMGISDTLRKG